MTGRCTRAPDGWWCSREPDHDGPCAARPKPHPDDRKEDTPMLALLLCKVVGHKLREDRWLDPGTIYCRRCGKILRYPDPLDDQWLDY